MSLAGEAIVAIWHDIAPEGRDEFYDWHIREHMSERVGIPGFLRGRRYIAERGAPEFFTLYEALTPEVLAGQDYLNRLNNPTPWTMRAVRHFKDVARALQRVRFSSGPGMGGHLLTMQLSADDGTAFADVITREILLPLAAAAAITGVHLAETDGDASQAPTREKAARAGGTSIPAWSLMVEAASVPALDAAVDEHMPAARLRDCGAAGDAVRALYRLEYVRTKTAFCA